LLIGAVVGLYPFQTPVAPQPGFELHGRILSEAELASVAEKDWPLARFEPAPRDLAGSAAALAAGLFLTFAVSRFGSKRDDRARGEAA
jgi:hypothetical protein